MRLFNKNAILKDQKKKIRKSKLFKSLRLARSQKRSQYNPRKSQKRRKYTRYQMGGSSGAAAAAQGAAAAPR